MDHERFLRRAIELSAESMQRGDQPFGALLVKDGEIVLEAHNTRVINNDATQHAELNLVSKATQLYDTQTLRTCTLYTSTEPCTMCTGAIGWAVIGRIVYACPTELLSEIVGRTVFTVPCRTVLAHHNYAPEVIGPLLAEEAAAIHRQYWPHNPPVPILP